VHLRGRRFFLPALFASNVIAQATPLEVIAAWTAASTLVEPGGSCEVIFCNRNDERFAVRRNEEVKISA
jgi:hypothetical protein